MTDERLVAVKMPKLGMAMTNGKVVAWLKNIGESIQQGEELVEIEGDKAVNVLESTTSGQLVRKVAPTGADLTVGCLLAVIAREPVDSASVDRFVSEFQAASVPETESQDNVDPLRYLKIDEALTLGYRKFTAHQPGGGPPLLLVHGFGGTQQGWAQNVRRLSESQDVYTIDLPGHGTSTKHIGDGTLSVLAKSISSFMAKVGLSRSHLVGHSLGASVLSTLAMQTPGRAVSLTLISGLGGGTKVDRSYIEQFLAADRRKSLSMCMQRLFASPASIKHKMIETVLKSRRMENAVECLRGIAEAAIFEPMDTDPAVALSRLTIPVQVIWGETDRVSPVAQLAGLPAAIPRTVIRGGAHMVHMESADEVDHLISSFVNRLASPSRTHGALRVDTE